MARAASGRPQAWPYALLPPLAYSFQELAERLAEHGFVRVHRSYLVNPEHVVEVHPFFAGTYILRMDDRAKSEVPVSRNYARVVRDLFGLG
mgnify:CR=1 FL=1